MTLGQMQRLFSRLVPRLIDQAHALGFEVAIGEVERHPVAAIHLANRGLGTVNSLHRLRLAIDLHLFRDMDQDGDLDYLTDTAAHRELGEWWEKQHPLCRWGGRFKRADGNHYSIAFGGRA